MLSLTNAATLGFSSTPTSVDGVYGGAFLFPDAVLQTLLEIPFFVQFEENYGTLYMYGDKNAWDMSSPVAPEEFGCALFLDTFAPSTLFGGTATGTMAPFCATMTEASSGSPVDYAALWAMRTSATGGTFFPGVQGDIDLTGGYTTTSAIWTDGSNIGNGVVLSDMALNPDYSTVVGEDNVATESVAPIFVFSEGKVCYDSPPLWNGMYPDTFATYAAGAGVTICLDKIA